ncbi:MepB family protein [Pseudomonas sp. 6D_7.1_Bac1]|uniref:MepB family protein n=1 Tax=Pseudomonas sp. 6D_7.1_Bac1 TaxID=2971615 RepID=UPI0021CA7DE8|nr:MepB family protein [Pseudomonas sp. 6D_7.1_Bac1]MCU1752881.1 MepB family protein [Pseudomonas sp. 6D_7.1_Bac1]
MKSDLTDPHTKPAQASPFLPHDLTAAIQNVYELAGMKLTQAARPEAESAEYGAARFGLDGRTIVFRVAKTTPTKIGQFVTLWKRPTPGSVIAPLDTADGVGFVVVSVCDATHRGQFVFDPEILVSKGILSINGKGGKRAIRVYPPWVQPVAKDAVRTQQWQLRYFLPLDHNGNADAEQVRRLFGVNT